MQDNLTWTMQSAEVNMGCGNSARRPKPSEGIRFETAVKAGIMNMIDGEEEEAGKESASMGLGALFICKATSWCIQVETAK